MHGIVLHSLQVGVQLLKIRYNDRVNNLAHIRINILFPGLSQSCIVMTSNQLFIKYKNYNGNTKYRNIISIEMR